VTDPPLITMVDIFSLPECQPTWDHWMHCWRFPCGFRERFNPVLHGDVSLWLRDAVQEVHRLHHNHQTDHEEWYLGFDTTRRVVWCECEIERASDEW